MIDVSPLVETRGQLLFKLASDESLLSTNEPAELVGDPAPDLYVCLADGRLRVWWASRVPHAMRILFQDALGANVVTEEAVFDAGRRLAAVMKTDVSVESGPAFRFKDTTSQLSGETILITAENLDVIAGFPYIFKNLDPLSPCLVRVADGVAVSVCRTVRRFGMYVECGVDTLPGYEGHGYGSAVVHDWGAVARQRGLVPLYSTQWANKASRGVARRLGLIQYATDISITFEKS